MMWYDHGSWGAGGWVVMGLMMLVFWGGLVAVVAWLINSSRRDGPPPPRSADELLAERFARGEIDEDEFTHRRELLHSSGVVGR